MIVYEYDSYLPTPFFTFYKVIWGMIYGIGFSINYPVVRTKITDEQIVSPTNRWPTFRGPLYELGGLNSAKSCDKNEEFENHQSQTWPILAPKKKI